MTWLFILAFMVVQLAIGLWISRRIRSESDFFLGGRNLPLIMVAFSLFATWFGAETCMGSSAAVYRQGLSGSRADPFGFSLCLFLMGLILAGRLRGGNYITLADYYRERFGVCVEKMAVWIMIPSSLIWGAAQIRAFGQVIASTTPLPVTPAITAAALFVLVYTLMGGMLGDIYTDIIQGFFIFLGLIVLFFVCFQSFHGWREMLGSMDPGRLRFIGPTETLLQRMDRWMVPVLGSLVTQEAISRVLAAKSVSVARRASFLACGIYLSLGSIPVLLGLVGPNILPGVAAPEQFLIRLAGQNLPRLLFVVFSSALISAIISTVDSILLAISALVSHNLLVPLFGLKREKTRVLSARLVVLASGVLAYVIAVHAKGIYELVLTASSFGTAGILVVTLMGLFTRVGGGAAAMSALAAGLVLTPLFSYVLGLEAPFMTSILGALAAFAAGAFMARRRERVHASGNSGQHINKFHQPGDKAPH
ncbi:MAG: sodium:solute symporter family protein [Clostridiales bacterium]|nr:sodium:solute symporter family protein [Clostridiales bacterium]